MLTYLRCVRSDCQKLRRTFMLPIHVFIPAALPLLFIAYYRVSPWAMQSKLSAFFEVVAISFPLVIGLLCGKAAEQEGQAGGFQNMLCAVKSRTALYISKLSLLYFLGVLSTALTVAVFGVLFKSVPAAVYVKAILIICAANAFLYLLHQFVSLQFGRGASTALGIVESLISALALTGLGDGVWYYIPCTWAARLCDYLVYAACHPQTTVACTAEMTKGLLIAAFSAAAALAASIIWFERFEGRKVYD